MSLLRTIESRIANLVEGTFGRVFRTNVQPVEIARRLVKEMDDNRRQAVRNVYVPNVYDVFLSRDDHRQFREMEAALQSELAEYLSEHARRNGYVLSARPRVSLHMDRDLEVGSFGIATKMEQGSPAEQAPRPASPAPAAPQQSSSDTIIQPLPVQAAATPDVESLGPPANWCLVGSEGPVRLAGARTTIGRGKAMDVVLHDSSVSREHAEVLHDAAGCTVRDLDSTNGVRVNGARVREHPIAPGDLLRFGNAEMRFERAQDGARG